MTGSAAGVSQAALWLWSSGVQGPGGIEFCSVLASSAPGPFAIGYALCAIARALNATLVHSRVRPATGTRRRQDSFPEGPAGVGDNRSTTASTVYRGGGFGFDNGSNEQALKAFFVENTGKQYRVPQFLASSFNWEVAEDFIQKSIDGGQVTSGGKTVLWKIEIC